MGIINNIEFNARPFNHYRNAIQEIHVELLTFFGLAGQFLFLKKSINEISISLKDF